MNMIAMRLITIAIAILLICATSCSTVHKAPWEEITTTDTSSTPSLVGRWKSDTVPVGYWIVDRHADGRYAKKEYLAYDFDKPHEVVLVWGRWELEGNLYRSTMEGTNSDFLKRFVVKPNQRTVKQLTHDQVIFEGREGDREERRVSITVPLSQLKLPVPKNSKYGWFPSKHGIITPKTRGAPSWIDENPLAGTNVQ